MSFIRNIICEEYHFDYQIMEPHTPSDPFLTPPPPPRAPAAHPLDRGWPGATHPLALTLTPTCLPLPLTPPPLTPVPGVAPAAPPPR